MDPASILCYIGTAISVVQKVYGAIEWIKAEPDQLDELENSARDVEHLLNRLKELQEQHSLRSPGDADYLQRLKDRVSKHLYSVNCFTEDVLLGRGANKTLQQIKWVLDRKKFEEAVKQLKKACSALHDGLGYFAMQKLLYHVTSMVMDPSARRRLGGARGKKQEHRYKSAERGWTRSRWRTKGKKKAATDSSKPQNRLPLAHAPAHVHKIRTARPLVTIRQPIPSTDKYDGPTSSRHVVSRHATASRTRDRTRRPGQTQGTEGQSTGSRKEWSKRGQRTRRAKG